MSKSGEIDFPKIIYIAGYGRSGSTVLDILLGNHQGIVSLGEVTNLFQSEIDRKRCSCGSFYNECPMWSRIINVARKSNPSIWDTTSEIVLSVESARSVIASLLDHPFQSQSSRTIREIYCEGMRRLFATIRNMTQVSTVVDSSKTAWRAIGRPYALFALCGFDVRVIHLIRDGRAVMWSTMKGSDPDIEHDQAKKSTLRGYQKVLSWAAINILTALILKKLPKDKVFRLHYEDLVDRPEEILDKIGEFINADMRELQERVTQKNVFKVGHLLRGNRIARQKEAITIIADYSWKQNLSFHDHLFYWLLLWPAAFIFRRGGS